MLINILTGLFGLGLVVFVHELGHFAAARAVGIDVETFSIGWGKRLWGFTHKGTEFRISVFPLGGYCKMKGEKQLVQAWETNAQSVERTAGTFYGAAPWRRIVVSLAGPFVNLVFAIVVSTVIWLVGFDVQTYGNRVVLAADLDASFGESPAERSGIQTGDAIVQIGRQPVETFRDIQLAVGPAANIQLMVTVERNGERFALALTPALDTETGAGRIGIYPWIEPVIGAVSGPAEVAGLKPGDRIVAAHGRPVHHSLDVLAALELSSTELSLRVERPGPPDEQFSTLLVLGELPNGEPETGIQFQTLHTRSPQFSLWEAFAQGVHDAFATIAVTVRSLGNLFRGLSPTRALSGPIRITYMVGEVAAAGFAVGFAAGLTSLFSFLSLLSVALFFGNLLPIPVLDGGQVVLFIGEIIKGKPIKPKTIYRYQMVGTIIVLVLIGFTMFSDVLFLSAN